MEEGGKVGSVSRLRREGEQAGGLSRPLKVPQRQAACLAKSE